MVGIPSEFGGSTQRNGIQPPIDPDGRPGHTNLDIWEKLRLEYGTSQPADEPQDTTRNFEDTPDAFDGLDPLPTNLKAPKYVVPSHKGAYVEDK